MMTGFPNWWSMHPPSLIPPQYLLPPSSISFNFFTENPDPPQSWTQLLSTGLPGEEEKLGFIDFQQKKLENWDVQILNTASGVSNNFDEIKQETSQRGTLYEHEHEEFQASGPADSSWSHMVPVSSSGSCCVTSISGNNIFDFSYNKSDHSKNLLRDQISECNSTATVGVCKKARVQSSSSQAPIKVRKEKLSDRITTLHQLVSPFGKTDTASVLLEAIGYIRFLQGQIEALSSPYLEDVSKNTRNQQSLLKENNGLKRKGATNQEAEDKAKELKSRGLCLMPVSCTQDVVSQNDWGTRIYGRGF
ncbi:transcription factor bHLH68-like [Vigna umbellata]|uniref:transcription factor bHLH68-like n=1 Tax=Vigna umbellata TaxID=87088 RepID=UPI001F5EC9C0|nr:transcription factor bHLH68-like [Vigna umbellata]